jgi:hypothetical protein
MAFSSITRIVEYLEEDVKLMGGADTLFTSAVQKNHLQSTRSSSDAHSLQGILQETTVPGSEKLRSSDNRLLYRPSLGHFPDSAEQDQWTDEELKTVAEEGISLIIVFELRADGSISYISPSVEPIFGKSFY